MSDMNFGVNIIPTTNDTYSLGSADKKWQIYANNATTNQAGLMSADDKSLLESINQSFTNLKTWQFEDNNQHSLKSLVIKIEPQQAGTGDPTSENVRAITGWTGAQVFVRGKNFLDYNSLVWENQVYDDNGQSSSSTSSHSTSTFIPVISGQKHRLQGTLQGASGATAWRIYRFDANKNWLSRTGAISASPYTTSIPDDCYYIKLQVNINLTLNNVQIELGTTETTYEAYKGHDYTSSWGSSVGTIYGGTYDMVSGLLTVTHGYIDSYNGETLPGAWISDRDVYTAESSPTTGAQVVYELATPQTYQLAPQRVMTVTGKNYIWSNVGTISVPFTHEDKIAVKADKVFGAINGNFAALNSSGNIIDSGHKPSDYVDFNQLEFIDGTNLSASPALTGVTASASLSNGKIIYYRLAQSATVSSNNALTLQLTLPSGSTTGAIGIYTSTADVCDTSFSAGAILNLIYYSNKWIIASNGLINASGVSF